MNKKYVPTATLVVVIVVLFLYLYWSQRQEINRLNQSLSDHEQRLQAAEASSWHTRQAFTAQTELVHDLLRKVPEVDATTLAAITKLEQTAIQWAPVRPEVAQEIATVGNLLKAEEAVKAVATMATILENLLKEWLLKDDEFRNRYEQKIKKQSLNLGNLIDFVADKQMFTSEEILFLKEVREIRNQSFHELAVHKAKSYLLQCQERCVQFLSCLYTRVVIA